jgi:hypothetical protein
LYKISRCQGLQKPQPLRKQLAGSPRRTIPITSPNLKFLPQAVFSFLKETKGIIACSLKDLSKSPNISASDAKRVAAALEMQGYIKPHEGNQWITTLAGEMVSGAKSPRYTPEASKTLSIASNSLIRIPSYRTK